MLTNFLVNHQQFSRKHLNKIPNQAGCYLFFNSEGQVIYIGKARSLQKRVSSYFPLSARNYFHQQISFFNLILTHSEKEALILEQNFIKKHQPRFNILLKDSHYYPYIEITKGPNPRYRLVRKINPASPSKYYGPFPDGSKAREILQLLERLFPLAKCKGNLGKPCFYYTIDQCSGHCWKIVSPSYYEENQKKIQSFFQGRTQFIKKKIKDSMRKNMANLAFEIAAKERKILDNIDFFTSPQKVEFRERQNCDFLGIYYRENVIAFYLFIYRYGKLFATEEAIFPLWTSPEEICETYLYQFYQNNLPPQLLYVPHKFETVELLGKNFGFGEKVPYRGRKKQILSLAQENAQQIWQRNYWNEFQQVNRQPILEEISNFLSLPLPNKIECVDISNLYKQDVVAGFLTLINGEKNLSNSKLYKLPQTESESDLARLKKACSLHYQKYANSQMPNLVIVDGGKEQVKVVQQSLKELGLKSAVIGLVKDENHRTAKIITSQLKELEFRNEKIKNFFTGCQETVHYYALNFHRKLHRRSTLKN